MVNLFDCSSSLMQRSRSRANGWYTFLYAGDTMDSNASSGRTTANCLDVGAVSGTTANEVNVGEGSGTTANGVGVGASSGIMPGCVDVSDDLGKTQHRSNCVD
ncbi:hypothetical protein PoB_005506900 [Plakobranchus ocellatus]|uniref:Uncharacterized protein n=1 Tax=Plakobranchus ocellatus TaxID=259542 RepID=A0AAV4C7N8_9GAST|nr:hypothetical protein PoB_005506900 [Plakobranchus ocellatus]